MSEMLYLSEADVVSLVDLGDAIAALEEACAAQGRGETVEVVKALATFGEGASMHALGSVMPKAAVGGFKTWINTKRGAAALMTVFDVVEGRPEAIIEAGALGQMRTAAISGVATDWLAAPDADEMAVIGTGRQALMQVAAVASVRPIRRLRVFSPNAERRAAFADRAQALFEFAVVVSASLEAAVKDAAIVTLVTRSQSPFLHADMLAPGAHLNAVGAILPQNAEFSQGVFDRASLVVVDALSGVQRNSREFIDRFGPDTTAWQSVRTLGEIISQAHRRPDGSDITLFKAMGMGLSDLAVARLVIQRARAKGIGFTIPAPQPVTPRWRTVRVRP